MNIVKKILVSFFVFWVLFTQSVLADDSKTTFVFLDGGPGIDGLLEHAYGYRVRKSWFRVVTVSQREAKSLDIMVKKIYAETPIRGKVVLVCHSAGCISGQVFAAKYPEKIKKLIMIEPVLGTGSDYKLTLKQMVSYYKKIMKPEIFKKFMSDFFAAADQGGKEALRMAYKTAYLANGIKLSNDQLKKLNPKAINSFGRSVLMAKKIRPQENTFPVRVIFAKKGMFGWTSKEKVCKRWKNVVCKKYYIGNHVSVLKSVMIP